LTRTATLGRPTDAVQQARRAYISAVRAWAYEKAMALPPTQQQALTYIANGLRYTSYEVFHPCLVVDTLATLLGISYDETQGVLDRLVEAGLIGKWRRNPPAGGGKASPDYWRVVVMYDGEVKAPI